MSDTTGGAPDPLEDPLFYPIVLTNAGVVPQPPATLRQQLINLVQFGTDPGGNAVLPPLPGYTAGLPGSLIEDIASTDVGAMILCDQARVELINSLTPFGCNAFVMAQLGQLFGLPFGTTTNVSVQVIFSGSVGFMIQSGFQVGDGTNIYIIQQGGIISSGGASAALTAVAVTSGPFPCPAGSVTQIVTSVPTSITLTVTNPTAGTGGNTQETEQQYRVRMLQASIVACQGTPTFLKTLLEAIPGVVPQQVGVQSVAGGSWKVICGGSSVDPFAVANAIYQAVPIIGSLVGSTMTVTAVTNANPGVVTTLLNHGYATGQVVTFHNFLGMTALNTGNYTITVITEKTFSIGVDTTSDGTYTASSGTVAPNLRNSSVAILDQPDIYTVPFVTPPQQTVIVQMEWYTAATVTAISVINQVSQGAIVAAINEIPVGQAINLLVLQEQVQDAVAPYLLGTQLSQMLWTVQINGITTSPGVNTQLIVGDPESYFTTTPANVSVTLGS